MATCSKGCVQSVVVIRRSKIQSETSKTVEVVATKYGSFLKIRATLFGGPYKKDPTI